MSQSSATNRDSGGGAPPAEVRWDTSTMSSQFCDVASITATGSELVLNFGASQKTEPATGEPPAGVLGVRLLRRVALRPMAARNLRDMLRNLIAEIDAQPPANRT